MKRNIATIVESYLECALWTNEIDDMSVKCNVSSKSIKDAILQVQCFLGLALPLLTEEWTDEQIGHDLWLTRGGHGAGFWDRGLPNGDKLTEICKLAEFHGEVWVDRDNEIVHIDGDENAIDLFENYELLPQNVQDLLIELGELEDTYEDCDKLISRLEELGYTCSYYLNAEPYDLRLNEEPTFDGQSEPYNANH
jgi:hypothetical protein